MKLTYLLSNLEIRYENGAKKENISYQRTDQEGHESKERENE